MNASIIHSLQVIADYYYSVFYTLRNIMQMHVLLSPRSTKEVYPIYT